VLRTEHAKHGDYSTNAALVCAKTSGKNPQEVAEEIRATIEKQGSSLVAKTDIAGPGFVNFFLTNDALEKELRGAVKEPEFLKGEKINIEFISANPTGELHIGHGRGAFYGDVLANVFSFAGAEVVREYYINDSRESVQIKELGKTALGTGEQYKTEKTEKIIAENDFSGMDESEAGFALAEKIQEANKKCIEGKLGVRFNNWYSEDNNLRATGANDKTLEKLKSFIEKKEGEGDALWLKTSEYGDDEDRVVVRSDGSKSYFIADIAYHEDKFARGFNRVIDVWGADHHGHVKRMHAVGKMLGWPQAPESQPVIFITQLVSLKKDGEVKKMSKRAGTVIGLEDLVDEFGIDVVRWFFAEKALSTHMEFDAELAKEQSEKNPVYYVQYAHARTASILRNTEGLENDGSTVGDVFAESSARVLAFKIAELTEVVETVVKEYGVHKLTTYAYELALVFSSFYHDVRVVKDDDTYNGGAAELAGKAQETLAQVLYLLGISAPEKM